MALKPDRTIVIDDISYFFNAALERGGIACQSGVASSGAVGTALDSSRRVAQYVANPSGVLPLGLVTWDVVNIDLSRQQLNKFKSESQIGSKVQIVKRGTFTTNMLYVNAASGNGVYPRTLYVGASGNMTDEAGSTGSGWPVVGRVLTAKDSEGYAQVEINL